ncbi:MAG TPA: lysophospholipid acyltransferase family protein [Myxococcota bacterium]
MTHDATTPPGPGAIGAVPPTPAPDALGRDPFAEDTGIDPLWARLDALERPRTPRAAPAHGDAAPRAVRPRPARVAARRRGISVPTLAEVDPPEARAWIERLLAEDDRRVLAAFAHLVEGESAYDRFGFSPDALRSAFPLFRALYRAYFRVKSEGHRHLPVKGPAILAANHAGLLPFDAAMAIVDVAIHTDPPRLLRTIVDHWAGTLPWVNVFYARMGQVVGTRENCADLLDEGQLLLVFPEGIDGVRKTIAHRYRLQHFRVGFVEHALRAGAPIIPTAIVGSDDQAPILYDIKPLARRLGLPVAPVTPTFPWLGPLGLLPYPVRYRIVYGEPLRFHERFGAESANDVRLVRYLTNQVRRTVQQLLDRSRA